MVNIREKLFLIAGSDFQQRKHAIDNIKKRLLPQDPAEINSLVLYSREINPRDLQEKISTAAFGKNKIIIFKDFVNISAVVRKIILENMKKKLANNHLIFETERSYYELQQDRKFCSDKLFSFILKNAAAFRISSLKRDASLNDMARSLRNKDLKTALYIFEKLCHSEAAAKILAAQVIGMLVSEFSYYRGPDAQKHKSFDYIWEADRAIKEKGLDARLIVEALLVRLLGLKRED